VTGACHTPAVDVDEARVLLEQYWRRVWHDRELGAVEQFMTDPYVRHSQAGTRVLTHAQVKDELARAWELLHGAVSTVDDVAVAGDRIWGRVTTRGMNLQTGERSVLTWLGSYRLEGGRFAESWNASLPGVDWHEPRFR
jgi:hypothetical protein